MKEPDFYANQWEGVELPPLEPALDMPQQYAPQQPAEPVKKEWQLLAVSASCIKPQPIHWAWPGWIALGKLTILAGAGGTGKTTLALSLIATLTTGGRWPDGVPCKEKRSVLIWSSEDDPADTIVPRLIAAGADLSKVYILQGRISDLGEREPFDPAKDAKLLRQKLEQLGDVGMIMLDPIVSAVSGDLHRANDVRRALQGLVDMAEAFDCAVLGITHFSKGSAGRDPAERVLGSQAFGALARTVLVAAKEEDSDRRVLARAKSNIADDSGGCTYSIVETTVQENIATTMAQWGEMLTGSARDILAEVEKVETGELSEKEEAEQFLVDLLSLGEVPTKQIKADAAGAGHSWRTIERAKRGLGIESVKTGMGGGWVWRLGVEDRQQNTNTATKKSGGLRENVAVFGKELAALPSGKFEDHEA